MDLYGDGHKFVTDDKVNTDVPMYRHITNDDTWANILGAKNAGNRVLVSFRDDTNGNGPTIGNFGSGIAFGGGDTKGVLSVEFASPRARIAAGNGVAPSWNEDIAWKSDIQNLNQLLAPVLSSNIKQFGKTDVNNLPSGWCLVTDNTSPNLPPAVSAWCICFTLYVTDTDRFQIAIAYNMTDCNIYVRTRGGTPPQWITWKKISYSA